MLKTGDAMVLSFGQVSLFFWNEESVLFEFADFVHEAARTLQEEKERKERNGQNTSDSIQTV